MFISLQISRPNKQNKLKQTSKQTNKQTNKNKEQILVIEQILLKQELYLTTCSTATVQLITARIRK
jgi:hypothetical protein